MSHCHEHRDELLEAVPNGAGAVSPELAAHLASCATCSAQRARRARLGTALDELVRRPVPAALDARVAAALAGHSTERAVSSLGLLRRPAAPAKLDGLVVSAMNAGQRQERAAASVVGLARRPAPGALDGRVQGLPARRPAPGVLDRLVAEELADPSKAMAGRFLGRLERRAAPQRLERRLASERRRGPAQAAASRSRRAAIVSSLVAAALLAWFGVAQLSNAPQEAPTELTLEFRVERARSIDELGPMARGLAGLVAGADLLSLGEAR